MLGLCGVLSLMEGLSKEVVDGRFLWRAAARQWTVMTGGGVVLRTAAKRQIIA